MNCPKCGTDISDSYEPDDWSVGISAGWYCNTCDLPLGDDGSSYDPLDGDVSIISAKEARGDRPLGTPISQLSGRPGEPGFDEFRRIAQSWGYE